MAHVPGQNVYEYVVMICRVLPLAVAGPGSDDELDEDSTSPIEPSSGYSVNLAREMPARQETPSRWKSSSSLDELEESATSVQHEL